MNVIANKVADRSTTAAAAVLAGQGIETGFGASRANQARMYDLASTLIDDGSVDVVVFGRPATAEEIASAKRLLASRDDLERMWDDHAQRLATFADMDPALVEKRAVEAGWRVVGPNQLRLDHGDGSWQTARSFREACAISAGNNRILSEAQTAANLVRREESPVAQERIIARHMRSAVSHAAA